MEASFCVFPKKKIDLEETFEELSEMLKCVKLVS